MIFHWFSLLFVDFPWYCIGFRWFSLILHWYCIGFHWYCMDKSFKTVYVSAIVPPYYFCRIFLAIFFRIFFVSHFFYYFIVWRFMLDFFWNLLLLFFMEIFFSWSAKIFKFLIKNLCFSMSNVLMFFGKLLLGEDVWSQFFCKCFSIEIQIHSR